MSGKRKELSLERWLTLAAVVAVLLGGYLVYEIGRMHAGYNRFDAAEERDALGQQIESLQAKLLQANETIVQQSTLRKTDEQGYAEVKASFADLQSKIHEQQEAIEFYRGIISPGDSSTGLKIQDLQILRGQDETSYRLRLVLVQAKGNNREVYGTVRLTIDGTRNGEAISYPYQQLIVDKKSSRWSYAFRYFQDFERELLFPAGFSPAQVNIELVPKGRGNVGVKQSFPWSTSRG